MLVKSQGAKRSFMMLGSTCSWKSKWILEIASCPRLARALLWESQFNLSLETLSGSREGLTRPLEFLLIETLAKFGLSGVATWARI